MRIGPLSLPWLGKREPDDPYWDAFVNRSPVDPNNLVTQAFLQAREGGVNPTRSEVHSPNVMASHIKELGRFVGADEVGIVQLASNPFGNDPVESGPESSGGSAGPHPDPLPKEEGTHYAVVAVLKADYDPLTARGIGGQTPAQKGLFATFILAAYIRELGYRATRSMGAADRERLAALAGLGTLTPAGRLANPRLGRYAYVAEVIHTELPLEPDGREVRP